MCEWRIARQSGKTRKCSNVYCLNNRETRGTWRKECTFSQFSITQERITTSSWSSLSSRGRERSWHEKRLAYFILHWKSFCATSASGVSLHLYLFWVDAAKTNRRLRSRHLSRFACNHLSPWRESIMGFPVSKNAVFCECGGLGIGSITEAFSVLLATDEYFNEKTGRGFLLSIFNPRWLKWAWIDVGYRWIYKSFTGTALAGDDWVRLVATECYKLDIYVVQVVGRKACVLSDRYFIRCLENFGES